MLSLPPHTLFHPPEEVARLIALSFLKDAKTSLRRLEKGKDPEALHDFRVALRKLRSCLRAYWPHVKDGVSKKLLNRVRDLARATAQGRDAEVEITLLSTFEDRLTAAEKTVLVWLLERLEARRKTGYEQVLDVVARDHARIQGPLAKRLSAYKRKVGSGKPADSPCFVEVTRRLILEQGTGLVEDLSRVRPENEDLQHEVRIETKKLRYLMEPIAESIPGGKQLVEEMKALQDLLGDLHDGKVVLADLAEAGKSIPAPGSPRAGTNRGAKPQDREHSGPPRLRSGLRRIQRLVKDRERGLLDELESRWLTEGATKLRARLEGFAEKLSQRDAGSAATRDARIAGKDGVEVERKFLLKELPEHAREASSVDIEQGWVPNKHLQERVRRARSGDEEKYYRTFKVGMDLKRVELEEEISKEVFNALWGLTKGHRVRKKRYRVADGDLVWEIDAFPDRDLVVAEVELPGEDTKVKLPSWLKRCVVREVTGDPAFYNVNLAS
jgi:CHAD domain-containing protein/CYTH domain-containing protein